jgi:hypothetical protein
MISDWLSQKYAHLDEAVFRAQDVASFKQKSAQWPELERALFEFQLKMERASLPITGDLLKQTAQKLWPLLPEYQGKPCPKFSNGFLDGFKMRHHIKRRKRHGEANSAPIQEAEPRMQEIREVSKEYALRDQFNMDETGLFWKLVPDSGLATEQTPGKKLEKSRITLAFCCNADGSCLLDPWVINKYRNPRCFGKDSQALRGRPLQWRANSKAWMDTTIMLEWLKWFDRQMTRRTLLLLDGFSAHECAVKTVLEAEDPPFALTWTRVEFLPPNVTSHFQPLDQGIIRTFKAYYKRSWLQFMVDCVEKEKDPIKEVDLLLVVRWLLAAWQEVTPTTVENCWIKSTCLGQKHTVAAAPRDWDHEQHILDEATQLLEQLEQSKTISKAMSIEYMLNPEGEGVEDSQGEVLDQVIDLYCQAVEPEPEIARPEVNISEMEVMVMLERLQLYEERQEDHNPRIMMELSKYERQVRLRMASKRQKQSTLESFWQKA